MAKILVLDDELPIAVMLKKALEKAGHEVRTASNGNEGMEIIKDFMPDLLITDILMPEKEGLELIMELKNNKVNIKIIAISGGGRFQYQGYLNSAKLFGADMVFQKPLDLKTFISKVNLLLETHN